MNRPALDPETSEVDELDAPTLVAAYECRRCHDLFENADHANEHMEIFGISHLCERVIQ